MCGWKVADRVRADQEPVLVVLDRGRVVVVVQAHLGRVAGKDEVLAVVVGEEQVLAAVVERVQRGVGVLLPLAEIHQVELVAIRELRAEEPDAPVDVREQEAAEVGVERLGAGPDRDEVVVGPQVGELVLDERLLKCPDFSRPRRPLEHVGAGLRQLAEREVADAQGRGQLDPPVDRLEGGVAVEQVEREREEIEREETVGPAEEVPRERALRALERRGLRGDLPPLEVEVGRRRDVEERVLAEDRIIPLEDVLVERVEPAAGAYRGNHR